MNFIIGIFCISILIFIFNLFKIKINFFRPSFFLWLLFFVYFFIGELIFDLLISLNTFENVLIFEKISPYHNYIALYIYSGFLSLSFGILSANLLLKKNFKKIQNLKNINKLLVHFDIYSIFISLILIIQIIVTLFLLLKFGTVFNYNTWDDLRSKINLEGYWKLIIINYIWLTPITISLSSFLYFSLKTQQIRTSFSSLVKVNFFLAIINSLMSISFGYRTFVITSILLILLVMNILHFFSKKRIIFSILLIIFLYSIFTYFKSLSYIKINPLLLYDALFHRLFFEGYKSLYYIFEYVNSNGFQVGYTYIIDLMTKLPGKQETFSKILGTIAGFKEGIGMNVTLLGDFFINWSIFSIFLLYLIGFFYVFLEYIFLKNFFLKGKYIYLVIYSILFLSSYNLVLGGISIYFDVLIQIIITFFIFSFYTIINQLIKNKQEILT